MSDFYNLSIIIPVHTKNAVYLWKQATGQVDLVMRAFPGCKVVRSHLSGEVPGMLPGTKAFYQTGFFWCACLRASSPHTQRLQRGVPWREPWVFWLPFGGSLGAAFFLANDLPSYFRACLCLRAQQLGYLFLTFGGAVWAPLPPLLTWYLMRKNSFWACLGPPVLYGSGVGEESGWFLRTWFWELASAMSWEWDR